jgi:hypothetical protein
MIFYCPNCKKEVDVTPESTITTQNQRVAYKAKCPVCGQDMVEFVPENEKGKVSPLLPANPQPKPPVAVTPGFEPGINPSAETGPLTNPQGTINAALEQIEGK